MLDDDNAQSTMDEPRDGSRGSTYDSIEPIDFEPGGAIASRRLVDHRWMAFGAVVLVLLLFAAALYVFSGRSVRIAVEPIADTLELDGALFPVKLGDRWLLRPGSYTVRATRVGYEDLEAAITVEDRPEQAFAFDLVRLPGFLNVSVQPPVDSRVWIDGEPVGPGPLERHELRAGDYRLSVRAERYEPWESEITIEGREVEQTVSAVLQPAWAEVYLQSQPAGATLYVDGEPYGETPLTAEILAGAHELRLRLDGHKAWQRDLDVVARKAVDLPTVVLEKADNIIQVASAPGGASVTVDGEYRGQTPMELALAPGQRYRIGFAKAGYRSNSRLLDVVTGDEASLNVRLDPVYGEVLLAGTPDDAQVLVEGIPRGTLNERLRLPAHPHRIEVRREGFETYSTTITPNPDLDQRVEVALNSFAAIREARMPELWKTPIGYELRLIKPSGIFRMGSGRREQGRRSNEFMHQVQLARPFYLGTLEVSNADFLAFKAEHDSGVIERSTLSLTNQPVVRVTWDDAARFCNWLSQREGLPVAYREEQGRMVPVQPMGTGYRLPTEAEWAYVARYQGRSEGRAARRYPWGGEMPPAPGSGNYGGIEAAALLDRALTTHKDGHAATAPVGEYARVSPGFFDLGGNVHEWIHDYYVIHGGALGSIPDDPMGPASGTNHVIRGSSWRSASITELRLAFRDEGVEGADDLGFRIARYAE